MGGGSRRQVVLLDVSRGVSGEDEKGGCIPCTAGGAWKAIDSLTEAEIAVNTHCNTSFFAAVCFQSTTAQQRLVSSNIGPVLKIAENVLDN